jgi:hypothetical protein
LGTTITKDHHSLNRNLKLNGKYISNDGGNEGISIGSLGDTTITSYNTTVNSLDILSPSLTTGRSLYIDVNDSLTTATTKSCVEIDYDKSGVTGNLVLNKTIGLGISLADAATNHAGSFVQMIGAEIIVASANAQGSI